MLMKRLIELFASLKIFFLSATLLLIMTIAGGILLQYDVFGGWLFRLTLGLVAINLVACTAQRWSTIKEKPGIFLTHSAVIVIFLSGLLRGVFAQSGFLVLEIGQKSNTYIQENEQHVSLPFEVILKDFQILYWDSEKDAGTVPPRIKQFVSRLAIIRDGNELIEKTVMVNQPLSWNGWKFYQSGYDENNPGISIIQITKDPSIFVVYFGFALLLCGLTWVFLREPVRR
jgi:cytochrome c biogenesis protein ResB